MISVVVIAHDQQEYAPLAVRSVLAQTHHQLECIFVDDGSVDATFERVQALAHGDPRLKLFRKDNGGPGSARNYGAARVSADSEFIAFLDGDDLYRPDYVATAVRYLHANPQVGVVIPSWDFIDVAGGPLPAHRRGYRWVPSSLWLPRRLRDPEPATPFVSFYCGTGAVPFWIARVHDYRRIEGWDETLWMFEDVDMLCQLALVTEIHRIPDKLVDYRIHPRQATSADRKPGYRPPAGIGAVQEKWNRRHFAEHAKERTLDRACIYNRQVHLPLRALWVARRAFIELIRAPSTQSLASLAMLVGYFLRDFFYFKIFFWRSTRRYVSTRFHEVLTAHTSNDEVATQRVA